MKPMQSQYLFFLLFVFHPSLGQQTSQQQYSQQSTQSYNSQQTGQQYSQQVQQPQGKVQLEDIERDNLKPTQPQTTVQHSQSQQFLAYPQDQLVYTLPAQQAAYFQTAQQPATSLYAAQPAPTTSGFVTPQQQQQFFVQPYYSPQSPQSYPYIDFGGFPLYPPIIPYVMQQQAAAQASQVPTNVANDYYKTFQSSQLKTPQLQATLKTASATTQSPVVGNYLLSNTLPNAYYQPVSFTQPQNPQYYSYNSFYQVQNPQKSVYSSGIKSTTPSVPVKGKETDQFVPVSNGNYRYDFSTAEQNNYNKVRLSG